MCRNSVLHLDHIAEVDRPDGSVVFATNYDPVTQYEAALPNALGRHFRCSGVPSSECFGLVWQLCAFTVPDIFIVEEMKKEPFHRQTTNVALQ